MTRPIIEPLLWLFCPILLAGCIPPYLAKYQKADGPYQPVTAQKSQMESPQSNQRHVQAAPASKASIYLIDKNTFRFVLGQPQVWDGAVDVLLRNYNLNIVDKNSGIITTEWDSYYLGDKVYRNKISMLIKRNGWNGVDVIIYNNMEVLKEGASGNAPTIWLPTKGDNRETGRIVQNMATYLNQPAPELPHDMIARAPRNPENQETR